MKETKKELTVEQKIELTNGINMWEFPNFAESKEPNIRCSDGPCGVRYVNDVNKANDDNESDCTCFLCPSSAATTFNPELMYKLGTGLGKEAKNKNIDILLTPGINLKRSPLNGRNFEYYSEDPYLTGILASALVNGIQEEHVGVCIKHLCCNNKENYRYTNSSIVDERALNEIYLNPFRLVVEKSNPVAVMTSYNKLNDIYISENKELLDKMRNDYNFRGLFISDWGGVNDPVKSFKAGLNIEMPGNSFSKVLLKDAYKNKEINDDELNKNAEIIKQNYNFIHSNRKFNVEYNKDEIEQIAYEVAKESPVLLKNDDNVLPLNEDCEILVVGELFKKPITQGYGSSRINYKTKYSFDEEFYKYTNNYKYVRGYSLDNAEDDRLVKECLREADKYNKIIFFMGDIYEDCEGVDRKDISLPSNQIKLLLKLIQLKKEIIVILNTGSVVELPFDKDVKAILQSGFLGEVHQKVITEILFGKINPSGKLAETYPIKLKDNPLIFNETSNNDTTLYKESLYIGYRYYDSFNKKVSYPFGHGLSYSNFIFSNIDIVKEDEHRYNISFFIENNSDIDGSEVCQVYIRKKLSKTYHSYQQLKGFKKVFLKAHEKTSVQLILEDHAFEFYNDLSHKFEIESGVYEICVGNSSRNIQLIEFVNILGNETELRFKLKDLSCYYCYKTIEDFEFFKLLGFSILPKGKGAITLNSTINDIKDKFLGRRIYSFIKKQYLLSNNFLPEKLSLEMLDFLPIRMLVTMSSGALSYNDARRIVKALNSNVIKGSYILCGLLKGMEN